MFRATFPTLVIAVAMGGCARTRATDPVPAPPPTANASPRHDETANDAATLADADIVDAGPWVPPGRAQIDGPHEELALDAGRPVYYAMAKEPPPYRLIGHIHGMCGPPAYACGKWLGAGTEVGIMVCPTGNARCGDSPVGPPSWEAPTWPELVTIMDQDLERSIAKIEAKRPGAIRREGAVLTAYSRGAFAAPTIARKHPQRWPYLVLIEANVPLVAETLRAAGVRAVALVAGEYGTEIVGLRKTQADLDAAGFPAKLFVMRKTGHPYSEDMEYVMHDALTFVLAHPAP